MNRTITESPVIASRKFIVTSELVKSFEVDSSHCHASEVKSSRMWPSRRHCCCHCWKSVVSHAKIAVYFPLLYCSWPMIVLPRALMLLTHTYIHMKFVTRS